MHRTAVIASIQIIVAIQLFVLNYQISRAEASSTSSSSSSTIPISMPPGCNCHDISASTLTSTSALSPSSSSSSSASSTSCKKFDCGCSCDMTASMCDANCCCDPDCSENDLTTRFHCETSSSGGNGNGNGVIVARTKQSLPLCSDTKEIRWSRHHHAADIDTDAHAHGLSTFASASASAFASSSRQNNPTKITDFAIEAMEDLLCVQRDNSPVKGTFFEMISEDDILHMNGHVVDSEQANSFRKVQVQVQSADSYESSSDSGSGYGSNSDVSSNGSNGSNGSYGSGAYIVKDYIQAIIMHENDHPSNPNPDPNLNPNLNLNPNPSKKVGIWNMPSSSDGGFCNHHNGAPWNGVEFGINHRVSCTTLIDDLEMDCKSRLSIGWYTKNVEVFRTRTLSTSINYDTIKQDDNSILVNVQPITLHASTGGAGNVLESNDTPSSTSTPTSTPTKAPRQVSTKAPSSPSTKAPTQGSTVKAPSSPSTKAPIDNSSSGSTVWDQENKVCMQAVQRIDYNITTRSDGSIDSIAAYVTIVNIPGDTKFLQQEFSTTFTDMTLSTSIDATRMRSGNPGYIFGAPTLAGRKSDDGTHVNVSVEGMTVGNVGKNGGDCLATSKSFVIRFGVDSTVGCTLSLTLAELEGMCTQNEPHPYLKVPPTSDANDAGTRTGSSPPPLVPNWLIQDLDMVGIFGNADPADTSQWLPISNSISSPAYKAKSRIWNPTHRTCNGLISGMSYIIHWTYAGSVTNPQAKILRIEQDHKDDFSMTHRFENTRSQKHHFTTTVSWVFIRSESEILKLPPPNLLFTLPDDVFYPFQFSSGPAMYSNIVSKVAISIVLVILTFY